MPANQDSLAGGVTVQAAMEAAVESLSQALRQRRWQIACVESCTGGGLMATLTEAAGASEWFYGGFVTYDNRAKVALGVDANLIATHGAVSREVAQAMSAAGYARSGCPLVLAITGIAGPSGASTAKPVGTVWLDVFCQGQHHSQGGLFGPQENSSESARAQIRQQAQIAALHLAQRILITT